MLFRSLTAARRLSLAAPAGGLPAALPLLPGPGFEAEGAVVVPGDHGKKFTTWRKLWIALAEAEKELGLDISDEQIKELRDYADDINYQVAKEREKIVRHDVMSHVYAYGLQCPKAAGIIHLGATSCYVGDNTDLIIMKEALLLLRKKIINIIKNLSDFAEEHKALPTLGFTHFQAAQPTTVGKRATLWINELVMDLTDVDHILGDLKLQY